MQDAERLHGADLDSLGLPSGPADQGFVQGTRGLRGRHKPATTLARRLKGVTKSTSVKKKIDRGKEKSETGARDRSW